MSRENGCIMCDPAPHENCEVYALLEVKDPETRQSHTVEVCLEHYEAVKP